MIVACSTDVAMLALVLIALVVVLTIRAVRRR